jgi:predicted HD phosphohydrolase
MQIKLVNTSNGWQAETSIDLDQHRVLVIRTARAQAGLSDLVTRATVSTRVDENTLIHDVGSDSRAADFDQLVASSPCGLLKELTEKLVHEQHDKALAAQRLIRARIEQYYRQDEPLSDAACREELGVSHG